MAGLLCAQISHLGQRIMRFSHIAILTTCLFATSTTSLASAYHIATGDVLNISVYRQEDMTRSIRVDAEGFIRFPIAGRIKVTGKNPGEIEASIANTLRRKGYSEPEVVVSIESYAPRSVFVLGAVKESANMQIPEGSAMTAMQAISAAGGLAENANIDEIVVRRHTADGISTIKVPARQIINGKPATDVILSPSDTVIIPQVKPISVIGTAKNPGRFYPNSEGPLTLSQVIALAGGVERPNSLSAIRVTRGQKSFEVDLRALLEKGNGVEDMALEPGDIVYVPETRW